MSEHEQLDRVAEKLDTVIHQNETILRLLKASIVGEESIMALLDPIASEVARQTTVVGSVVSLLSGLAAQLTANANDPAAVAALASQIKLNTDALAAAVVQNTPAAAPTPPAPVAPPAA